ncbi:MAG: hypothetical protein RJA99_1060 [Pseudomonadota bacterium]
MPHTRCSPVTPTLVPNPRARIARRASAPLAAGLLALLLAACGGGGGGEGGGGGTEAAAPAVPAAAAPAATGPAAATPASTDPAPDATPAPAADPVTPLAAPAAPSVSSTVLHKTVRLDWATIDPTATYQVQRQVAGGAWTDLGATLPASSTGTSVAIDAHRIDWTTTRYRVKACNTAGCGTSAEVDLAGRALQAIGYLKASNAEAGDWFGAAVALSGDGLTMVVGAPGEQSDGSAPADNSTTYAGAAYVFTRTGSSWVQQRWLKASNAGSGDKFGVSVAISQDGATIAVGALAESSAATGVNGNQSDDSLSGAGAVYVFVRSGASWTQQAYLKAANAGAGDAFGSKVALSADGSTLLASAPNEASGLVNAPADDSLPIAGAAYVFVRSGTTWTQQAYLKAGNVGAQAASLTSPAFGTAIALSADGSTAVIGAPGESSDATSVDGSGANVNAPGAGAAYVFGRTGSSWTQRAYLKPSNGDVQWNFGQAVSIDASGTLIAVGAPGATLTVPVAGPPPSIATLGAGGAAYVFAKAGSTWAEQAVLTAPNPDASDRYGSAVALSADGTTLAVVAYGESSQAVGFLGGTDTNTATNSGAVYLLRTAGGTWTRDVVLKALNTRASDAWTSAMTPTVTVSADGGSIAVGFDGDDSASTGFGGSPTGTGAGDSGAVTIW